MKKQIRIKPVHKSTGYGNKLTPEYYDSLIFENIEEPTYQTDYSSDFVLLKIKEDTIYIKKKDFKELVRMFEYE